MAVSAGARCELKCEDKDGEPRFCPPGSEFTICPTCRGNIAGWSARPLLEAKQYIGQLEIRHRRMHEITSPTKASYVGQLQAKRRRARA